MNEFWENFLIEIILFVFLGLLYYFYQRRRILTYEENKMPLVMGFILQACLSEKGAGEETELDAAIEALDDYLHNRTPHPPIPLLKVLRDKEQYSLELRDVIREGLLEIEADGKE